MTRSQRIAVGIVGAVMLFAGFGFGRLSQNNASAEPQVAANQLSAAATTDAINTKENQAFYLKDFKTGFDDGYQAGLVNQTNNLMQTDRAGYNDGFKEGYADGVSQRQEVSNVPVAVPLAYRSTQRQVYYQPVKNNSKRRSTKLRTALTIAGPAAVGAGVGALTGGKKGAAVGALLGGGGGAIYHLFKNRN